MPPKPKYKLSFWIEWTTHACFWPADAATRSAFGADSPVAGIRTVIGIRRLPLSQGTMAELEALCDWYQDSLNWDYPPDPRPWRQEECDRFNAAALALYQKAATELGEDYELINAQQPVHEDPDLDAYLKDPKGYGRQ